MHKQFCWDSFHRSYLPPRLMLPGLLPTSHRDSRCRDYFLPPTATPVLPGLPPYTPRLSPSAGPRHRQFYEMVYTRRSSKAHRSKTLKITSPANSTSPEGTSLTTPTDVFASRLIDIYVHCSFKPVLDTTALGRLLRPLKKGELRSLISENPFCHHDFTQLDDRVVQRATLAIDKTTDDREIEQVKAKVKLPEEPNILSGCRTLTKRILAPAESRMKISAIRQTQWFIRGNSPSREDSLPLLTKEVFRAEVSKLQPDEGNNTDKE
uniref:Uncharacterized protein n=1 Tax=Timema douglasi TaxID=61478 RepID=A0A7R8ZAC4_TIMDO|nr:unnamed protein product [Timema douglasi]